MSASTSPRFRSTAAGPAPAVAPALARTRAGARTCVRARRGRVTERMTNIDASGTCRPSTRLPLPPRFPHWELSSRGQGRRRMGTPKTKRLKTKHPKIERPKIEATLAGVGRRGQRGVSRRLPRRRTGVGGAPALLGHPPCGGQREGREGLGAGLGAGAAIGPAGWVGPATGPGAAVAARAASRATAAGAASSLIWTRLF
jgi:hypothetical protein